MNKNNNGLFELSAADVALMEDIYILYSYNIMDNCNLYKNVSFLDYYYGCKNPKTFLVNYGKLTMNFTNVDIDMYPNNITPTNSSILFLYEYEISHFKDMFFIINVGDMNISNMLINKTISRTFIANLGSLYAEFVSFSSSFSNCYQPNELHSTTILMQTADYSFMELTQSYFVASHHILSLLGGGVTIKDSVFEKNNVIIEATVAANSILIKNCTFSKMGWVLSKRFFVLSFVQVKERCFIIMNFVT